jgi:tetratricopeptide (TPR) repeat protein
LDLNPPAELEQLAARGLVDAAYVICRLAPKKNWKDVLRFSRRARTILPNNSSAFQYCAIAEKKLGELKPALASVTRALELTPTRSERRARLHLLKADIYARLEKPTTRLAELKLAVSAPGGDTSPEIHGSLGDALLELQKLDSALVAYDRSIQLNPEQTHSYVRRSRTRRLLGDPQGALTDLTLAVGREDDLSLRVSYLQERASLYEQLNLVDKANADLERCAELNDRSAR